MLKLTALLVALAAFMALPFATPVIAQSAIVTKVPNNFPNVKKEPRNPGMTAILDVTSGTAHITVIDASTVTVDGVEFNVGDDHKMSVDVKHHAVIVTGTFIMVDFDGAGTYTSYRGDRQVSFEGKGTIDQTKYDEVRFFNSGNFAAANWITVEAHNATVVKTTDVRDVVAFENSDVTVTNCWIANGFSSVPVKATGCRYPQGNAVTVSNQIVIAPSP